MSPRARSACRCLFGALCILTAVTFDPPGRADEIKTGLQDRVYRDDAGEPKYTSFVPAAYTPERKLPVILYLQGFSARGTDNKLPLVGGLAPQERARAATFPFIVVFPQCEALSCDSISPQWAKRVLRVFSEEAQSG